MAVQIKSADSTERFVGTEETPRQVVRVVAERSGTDGAATVSLSGGGVRGESHVPAGDGEVVVEVPIQTDAAVGSEVDAIVTMRTTVGDVAEVPVSVTVAEPGWTMVMV